jgi:hypothetical protein
MSRPMRSRDRPSDSHRLRPAAAARPMLRTPAKRECHRRPTLCRPRDRTKANRPDNPTRVHSLALRFPLRSEVFADRSPALQVIGHAWPRPIPRFQASGIARDVGCQLHRLLHLKLPMRHVASRAQHELLRYRLALRHQCLCCRAGSRSGLSVTGGGADRREYGRPGSRYHWGEGR